MASLPQPGRSQPEVLRHGKKEKKMTYYLPILLAGALAITVASSTASAADIVDTAVAGKFNTLWPR